MGIVRACKPFILTTFMLMLICGGIYPLVSTGFAQLAMKEKADGSLLYNGEGEVIGSALIGQEVTDPAYFHGRISSIGYDASGSGSMNFAPSNPELKARVMADAEKIQRETGSDEKVPNDLITNSGSGLDPHITPESAERQIVRIAAETGLAESELARLIEEYTETRELGLFGEPRVNVLKLNLALQELLGE